MAKFKVGDMVGCVDDKNWKASYQVEEVGKDDIKLCGVDYWLPNSRFELAAQQQPSLPPAKFKVGDVVKCLKDLHDLLKKDTHYEVLSVGSAGFLKIITMDGQRRTHSFCNACYFELATATCPDSLLESLMLHGCDPE